MPKITMKKTGGILIADNAHAVKILGNIREGNIVSVDVRQPRNVQNHRRFFAFLSAVFDMQECFISEEALRFWLIMKAGYVESISVPNGTMIYKPKSIDFGSMEETEFKDLFNNCITVVVREFELDRDALNRIVDFA